MPSLNAGPLKFELDQTKIELEKFKRDVETANSQIKRLQTSVEFYKMKYEELEEENSAIQSKAPFVDTTAHEFFSNVSRPKRRRSENELELNRLNAELSVATLRLKSLAEEKQQREK